MCSRSPCPCHIRQKLKGVIKFLRICFLITWFFTNDKLISPPNMFTKICLFIVSFCWITPWTVATLRTCSSFHTSSPQNSSLFSPPTFFFFPYIPKAKYWKTIRKHFFLHSSKAFAQLIIVWYHCKCERVRVSLAHHLSLASCAVHRHDYIQHGGVGNLKFAHFGLLSCIWSLTYYNLCMLFIF